MTTRIHAILHLTALLTVGASAGAMAQVEAPAGQEPPQPTMEQRLNLQTVDDGLLLGGQPSGGDYKALAQQKGVKRVVCLLTDAELNAGETQAVKDAGMTLVRAPLTLSIAAGATSVDRAALAEIVATLATPSDGATYVHDESGHGRVGLVDFAYQIQQKKKGYADAALGALTRGFFAHLYPGVDVELKKLASGLETLPIVKGIPTDTHNLLDRGSVLPVGRQRLHIKSMGKGSPIYTLHGGPGETHVTLRPYFDVLNDDHLVVYYDQRGCGHSSKPQFKEAYTVSRLVVELDDLRKTMGHEKITLLGHSTGGIVALRYALTYPERVERLIVMSTWADGEAVLPYTAMTARLFSGSTLEAYRKLVQARMRERRGYTDEELAQLVRLAYPISFFGTFDDVFRKDWNRRAEVSSFTNNAMSEEFFRDLSMLDELSGLSGIPTLLLCGRYDIVTPPSIMQPIADAIPGARLEVFEQSGHYMFVEEHEKCIKLIREFLTGDAAKE